VSSKKTYCEFTGEENITRNKHDKIINQSLQTIKIIIHHEQLIIYIYTKTKKTMYTQTVDLFKNTILPMPYIYISFTNTSKNNIEKLQKDLDTLGEWAVENGMKINPSKCKVIRFMRAWVKNPLGHSLCDQKILEASSCKYL
jgi:hypothetical protein